VNLEIAKDQ